MWTKTEPHVTTLPTGRAIHRLRFFAGGGGFTWCGLLVGPVSPVPEGEIDRTTCMTCGPTWLGPNEKDYTLRWEEEDGEEPVVYGRMWEAFCLWVEGFRKSNPGPEALRSAFLGFAAGWRIQRKLTR